MEIADPVRDMCDNRGLGAGVAAMRRPWAAAVVNDEPRRAAGRA
jgi:hypothetical protein